MLSLKSTILLVAIVFPYEGYTKCPHHPHPSPVNSYNQFSESHQFENGPYQPVKSTADEIGGYSSFHYDTSGTSTRFTELCPKISELPSSCQTLMDCSLWAYEIYLTTNIRILACKLIDGSPGVCCPSSDINPSTNIKAPALKTATKDIWINREIDAQSQSAAAIAGKFNVQVLGAFERVLKANNIVIRKNSASGQHLRFLGFKEETFNISRAALAIMQATKHLAAKHELNPGEAGFGLTQFTLRNTALSESCPAEPHCDAKTINSPYRTITGACNNIRRTSWGKALLPVQRILPPDYADGVWHPRAAQSGEQLPRYRVYFYRLSLVGCNAKNISSYSARLVSSTIARDINSPSRTETVWLMQYGQFVTHDLTLSPDITASDGQGITCCDDSGQFLSNPEMLHPACFPIKIPKRDHFFSRFQQRCMSFVRTAVAPRRDCSFGYTEQVKSTAK